MAKTLKQKVSEAFAKFAGWRRVKPCTLLTSAEMAQGWRLFYVDVGTYPHTGHRECVASKQLIRYVITLESTKRPGVSSADWFSTKREAVSAAALFRSDGTKGRDGKVRPYYKNVKVRKAQEAKNGKARIKGRRTTKAKLK